MTLTPINRRTVLGLLGATALVGCDTPEVVSRNDNDPFEGGIGGTGIVGIMTGYGSLLVNGLRVELTNQTRVASPYGQTDLNALKPGMSLTIFASRNRDGLFARDVTIDYALVGLARVGAGRALSVNGVRVLPEPGALGSYSADHRVAVSGVWSPRGLIASRIDPAPNGQDLIAGTVSRRSATGLSISGASVRILGAKSDNGGYAVALGQSRDGQFEADDLQTGRFNTATGLRQLAVEGYLETATSDPGFRIAGLGHSFGRNLRLQQLASRRAIYFGRYTGLFQASTGYVIPENFAQRRQLLARGYDEGFGGSIVSTRT